MKIADPKSVPIVLMGFGNVGRAFIRLVHEKKDLCRARYGLNPCFLAVFEVGGALVPTKSFLEPADAPETSVSDLVRNPFWNPAAKLEDILASHSQGVLVECTPTNLKTGEPGLAHIRKALEMGWHVATASKGPLVVDFKGLKALALDRGVSLKFSGAAAAALPTLDVGLYSLAGTQVSAVEGVLNGTTNFILTRMGEGFSYAAALQEARERGIAEPDPSLDVEGWDTAAKILLIANAVMGTEFTLADLSVTGIADLSPALLARAENEGKILKLLGTVRRNKGTYSAGVAPTLLDPSHPLAAVNGTAKGITFWTDTMGSVTVTGGKSDPRGAAAALLKDIINIFPRD